MMIDGSSEIPDLDKKYEIKSRKKFDTILQAFDENVAFACKLADQLTGPEAVLFTEYRSDLNKVERHKIALRRQGVFLDEPDNEQVPSLPPKSSKKKKTNCIIS
ncbi:MAG: hypothetical protein J0H47_05060 [Gammaproteobacteria bacterium]|nr:hypothetical protein [Gammaproteobacteria bacterium]